MTKKNAFSEEENERAGKLLFNIFLNTGYVFPHQRG